jgi:PHP domain
MSGSIRVRERMRRLLLLLTVLALACVALAWLLAPPPAEHLRPTGSAPIVRGAFHVHTTMSDGAGTPEDVAVAAAEAGLDFVVLTDHGDATRQPVAPRYVSGVLVIDAVEISTTGGHYIALGLDKTPYRLAGEPRDVIEDVTRLGGFGVAAHPDSPKAELAWREWQAPLTGLEWLNADSAWRDESRRTLARALASYWLRAPEVLVSLFDRPSTTLARWDAIARRHRIVALAGHDAHARIGARGPWESPDSSYSLRLPGYAAAFRAFSLSVEIPQPPTRVDATADAAQLVEAIRRGRVFTVIDGLAGPARLDFVAAHAGGIAHMGDDLAPGTATQLTATLSPAVSGAELCLLKDGVTIARTRDASLTTFHASLAPASAYRVEVLLPRAPGIPPVPWIVGNHIRVGFTPLRTMFPLLGAATWSRPAPQLDWRIEQHATSKTTLVPTVLAPTNTAWTLTWELGGGAPAGQYAAIAVPVPAGSLIDADRISFTARSHAPMRASVQLRTPDGVGRRWRRSIYLSSSAMPYSVAFRELTPVEALPGTPPDRAHVDTILFVVDTVNTAPGSKGEIWISELRVEGGKN